MEGAKGEVLAVDGVTSPVVDVAEPSLRQADRGAWVPVVVLLVGLASALMLFATTRLRERRILEDIARVQAVGEIQTKIALSHLWLEEYVSGDEVPIDQIVDNIEAASALVGAMLSEPASDSDLRAVPALTDLDLRVQAEDVRSMIDHFYDISIERLRGYELGDEVGIGSRSDIDYDTVFTVLFERTAVLEAALRELRKQNLAHSRLSLWLMLSAWLALIALAVTGLWTRERRRSLAEKALRESEYRLLRAQKMQAVGRLAGGIAHDINNYLAAITSQCELVKLKAEPGGRVAKKMETVITTTFRASGLIERLLAFAKRRPLRVEVVDLNEVITGLESMMLRLISEDVKLKYDLQPDLWNVKVDPAHFEQVIVNLLVNAREAMSAGGEISIETRNRPDPEPGEVRISVRDTGRGIEPAIRSRIFEPFFTTKQSSSSGGLGLATVYGIVEQSKGWIEVESEVGQGTTFVIGLPRCLDEGCLSGTSRKRPKEQVKGGDEGILYLEDNLELRTSITALLEGLGYRVYSASNGATALKIFAEHGAELDLLVSDVVLPGLSGREVIEELWKSRPTMRVIFVSGYSGNVMSAHGVGDGEFDFLSKPFTARRLARMVREVLDRPAEEKIRAGE